MNYKLNEKKVFSDKVDQQLIFIDTQTFVYYAFNDYAEAVISDMINGNSINSILSALKSVTEDPELEEKLTAFVKMLLEEALMVESVDVSVEGAELYSKKLAKISAIEFVMDKYDDVAEYFAADPIHEVNPQMGWPNLK